MTHRRRHPTAVEMLERRVLLDAVAVGAEFLVNVHTRADQAFPSIAMDPNGDFVIAWQSRLQDGSNDGVYAQRYSDAGTRPGDEFRVNTYTTNDQRRVRVRLLQPRAED
jgi:hypothetical protein